MTRRRRRRRHSSPSSSSIHLASPFFLMAVALITTCVTTTTIPSFFVAHAFTISVPCSCRNENVPATASEGSRRRPPAFLASLQRKKEISQLLASSTTAYLPSDTTAPRIITFEDNYEQQCSNNSFDNFLSRVDELLHSTASLEDWTWLQEQEAHIHQESLRDQERFSWLTTTKNNAVELSNDPLPEVEWITVNNQRLAAKTTQPLLNDREVELLRNAANEYFATQNSSSSFTYQRKGNSEAHLGDLCCRQANSELKAVMQDALQHKIFPLVQKEFSLNKNEWDLYIYDSLFIRYNATAAAIETSNLNLKNAPGKKKLGAGQPLHRDMGVVSVNIMLNHAHEFQGGGTLFEEQLANSDYGTAPLKPSTTDRGHALLHYSSHRHAGAGTTQGVRDILVLFLSAAAAKSKNSNHSNRMNHLHPLEFVARIKERSKALQSTLTLQDPLAFQLKRALLYRTALSRLPTDGDAFHYLGTCLHALAQALWDKGNNGQAAMLAHQLSIEALLDHAVRFIPNDGRLFNNIGLMLGKNHHPQSYGVDNETNSIRLQQVEWAYRRSLELHESAQSMGGCDVETDLESTALNYGLFLSYQDGNRWQDAIDVLDRIDFSNIMEQGGEKHQEVNENENLVRIAKLREDAFHLRQFCAKQLEKEESSNCKRID